MRVSVEDAMDQELDLDAVKGKSRDVAELPDLYALERIEEKALWVLVFLKDKMGIDYLSALQISTILSAVFELSVDEAAVRMALTRASGKIHTKNFGRTKKFSVMKPGREHLRSLMAGSIIIVDPQMPHRAIRQISDLFGTFHGTVKICDPYLDRKTLEVTPMIPEECQVLFLSNLPKDPPALLRHLKAYKIEHPNLHVRSIPPGRLHDRYIVTTEDMWSVGHSLNAIGSKQTLVFRLGSDVRDEMERSFDAMWAGAQDLLP